MTQYIDKAALVAEIERRISLFKKEKKTEKWSAGASQINVVSLGARIAMLEEILSFLNTLEVKEVDLEKEIDKWWCSLFTDYSMNRVPNHKFIPAPAYIDSNFKQSETGKTKIAFELWMDWKVDSNDIEWDSETIREFARHFF